MNFRKLPSIKLQQNEIPFIKLLLRIRFDASCWIVIQRNRKVVKS